MNLKSGFSPDLANAKAAIGRLQHALTSVRYRGLEHHATQEVIEEARDLLRTYTNANGALRILCEPEGVTVSNQVVLGRTSAEEDLPSLLLSAEVRELSLKPSVALPQLSSFIAQLLEGGASASTEFVSETPILPGYPGGTVLPSNTLLMLRCFSPGLRSQPVTPCVYWSRCAAVWG